MLVILLFFLLSSLFFGAGLLSGYIAWRKGYRPWFWLFAFGPLGTLLLLFKPVLGQATTPELRESWEQRADWTGGVLSGFALFFMVSFSVLAGGLMISAPVMVPMPPPTAVSSLSFVPGPTLLSATNAKIEGVKITIVQPAATSTNGSRSSFVDGDRQGTRFVSSWSTSSDAEQHQCTVEIANSKLRVNNVDYGAVTTDDAVSIDGDSVLVNDMVRSPTP